MAEEKVFPHLGKYTPMEVGMIIHLELKRISDEPNESIRQESFKKIDSYYELLGKMIKGAKDV
jgi:hypothetical protein